MRPHKDMKKYNVQEFFPKRFGQISGLFMTMGTASLVGLLSPMQSSAQPNLFDADRVTVLGPAFSQHSSTEQAPVTTPGVVTTSTSTSLQCLAPPASQLKPGLNTSSLGGSSAPIMAAPYVSNCTLMDTTTASASPDQRQWTQTNPAFGIHLQWIKDGHIDGVLVDAVVDSFGKPSLMAAASRSWRVAGNQAFALETGAAAGIWYRTTYSQAGDQVKRLVPLVVPTLALRSPLTAMGLQIAYAPKLRVFGYQTTVTSTWMLQLTYGLH